MFPFLSEFTKDVERPRLIIVMEEESLEPPRQHQVVPRQVLLLFGGAALALVLVTVVFIAFTPLRALIPGYGSLEAQREAQLASVRLEALEDSMQVQLQYLAGLRTLLNGQVDSSAFAAMAPPEPDLLLNGESTAVAAEPLSPNWRDHEQPALPLPRLSAGEGAPVRNAAAEAQYLSSLRLPALAPVDGFLTRGFDARTGHYAVDLAVEEGTVVRSVGPGYVIFADWTHDGGYTILVQHADGYVSVYKHNQRLLKRPGDRVGEREGIAISGNSGEVTTGPHLHFELWHDGLAQDPRSFLIG